MEREYQMIKSRTSCQLKIDCLDKGACGELYFDFMNDELQVHIDDYHGIEVSVQLARHDVEVLLDYLQEMLKAKPE